MTDFIVAGILQALGAVLLVLAIVLALRGAEVRRSDDYVSPEWLRGRRS